jgi:hypothetical protein
MVQVRPSINSVASSAAESSPPATADRGDTVRTPIVRRPSGCAARPPVWLPQRPPSEISPATESSKNGVENFNEINGRNFVTEGPSVPLNVFGRGYRWPGAKANGNASRVTAAVDAELGTGTDWLTSLGGARYQVIPARRAR